MAKKRSLFSKKNLALLLAVLVCILLIFLIQLLPPRQKPAAATNTPSLSRGETNRMQTERTAAKVPEHATDAYTPSATSREKTAVTVQPAAHTVLPRIQNTLARNARLKLVVVIDDVGQNLKDLEPFLKIPANLTLSILPHLPYSRAARERIKTAGKEAILHMPMEPERDTAGYQANPGPGALYCTDSNQQLETLLDEAFASVPDVQGFNNHMGSLVTANLGVMRVIFRYAAARKLFFLDSRTTSATVAPEVAREYHVPFFERKLFLDNEPQAEAIRAQLVKAVENVVREADNLTVPDTPYIAIGHVQSHELAPMLREALALFKQEGIELARLDQFCN